ncbi:MAG: pseudouridine synthase, partial [Bacteroidetes bacterium]|nr:pseudouridine synthase [Bacteroidota bacterium]
KPCGIETTFHEGIANGLKPLLPFYKEGLTYAGRLDKESEGLLLLSNDGRFIEMLTNPGSVKEKEYIVSVHMPVEPIFIENMKQGVVIMGQKTRPCEAWQTGNRTFQIILTEGRNRQIRRMCHQLGYKVEALKRIRIDRFELGDMKPGEYRKINI